MGKSKKWSKKNWKASEDQKEDVEQDFDTLFEVDKVGKLSRKQKTTLSRRNKKVRRFPYEQKYVPKAKDPEGPIVDPWAAPAPKKRINRAPDAKHIIAGPMEVPASGSSYNPDSQAREKLVEKALKHIVREETKKSYNTSICKKSALGDFDENTSLADKIVVLQDVNKRSKLKITVNGDAMLECMEANPIESDDDDESEDENIVRGEKIVKKPNERKTRRQRNAKRRFREHEENRKRKIRRLEERKQLGKIETHIDEVLNAEPLPPKEKKVDLHPKMGPKKYEDSFPAIALQTELKGNLRSLEPVGNLVTDSYKNLQRRNKLEVRKRVSAKARLRNPKFKIQTVVGGRKGGMVVTGTSKYEY